MKKTGWIILGVVVLLVLWGLSSYNGIIGVQEQATTELANVQTQYQRRADMMPQLVKIVKAYAKHEKETFEAVTKARAAVGQVKLDANNLTPEKLKAYSDAQGELANAFSKLMVVAEKYPDLKAVDNFRSLQIQEEGTENRISEARRKYNDAVGELKVPYILMSVQPTLATMMKGFAREVQQLRDLGAKDIILDPGFCFGKNLIQNYQIYNEMEKLNVMELPVLVGISRKSMIHKLLGGDATTSLNGTSVLDTIALMKGASILRVHDVKEAVEAVKIVEAMKEGRT